MANLFQFWLDLLVTADHLNTLQDNLQAADRAMLVDAAFGGVFYGLAVAERGGGANLSVDVSAGAAYDSDGARVRTPSTQNVSVDNDYDAVPTAVAGVGNEKWLSVSIRFIRAESEPFVDGNSMPGNFVQDESFELVVTQGSEAPSGNAVRPALLADAVLLADVLIVYGQTQVLDADVSTARRQLPFDLTGTVHTLRAGRVGGSGGALEQLLGWFDGHVSGVDDRHQASAVDYAGGVAWANGATNPADTVEATFDATFSRLASTTGSSGGTRHIGAEVVSGTAAPAIPSGTLFSQLAALKFLSNLEYQGGAAWLDGTMNPATSAEGQLDKFVTDLTDQGGSTSGGHKIGLGARSAWLGGRTNPATTIYAGNEKIIVDLGAQASSDDGAERIGAAATAGLPAGSVRSQIDRIESWETRPISSSILDPDVSTSLTVDKFAHRINGSNMLAPANVALSAPDASLGSMPSVDVILVDAAGVAITFQYSAVTVFTFTGASSGDAGYKTWCRIQWSGSSWAVRIWGDKVIPALI